MVLLILSSLMVIQGDNFYQGKWDGAAITREGIFLSYSYKKVVNDIGGLVTDVIKKGKYIYAGTSDGNIYLIRNGKKKEIFNSGGNYVVFGRYKNLLLAGISPQGKIFRIKGDKVSPYLNLDADYIWDIKTNNKGDIFAATGPSGKIFRIKNGTKDLYFQVKAKNVTSLMFYKNALYAATSYPGIIYKIYSRKKGEVYFDPLLDEVRGIGFSADTMYIAGNKGNAENVQGIVLMVNDGIDTLYTGEIILSSTQWKGRMLVGESKDGEVGWLKNGKIVILYDFPEKKITTLKSFGNDILIGTGAGAIYLARNRYSNAGSFITDVKDGGQGIKWGRITADAKLPKGTKVHFFARGGFTSSPDSSWTEWKGVTEQIPVNSRFIQLKAKLTTTINDKTPIIKKIFISYKGENRAPIIKAMQVLPPGIGWGTGEGNLFARKPLSPEDIIRYKKMGIRIKDGAFYIPHLLRCITFDVKDPDGNSVNVSLILKMKNSDFSDTLSTNARGNAFFFDNTTFPDGKYILKIIAKDAPQGNISKTTSKQIDLIIDNSPPAFQDIKIFSKKNKLFVQGVVEDKLSTIQAVFVNIDGRRWKPVEAKDKIYDEKKEGFQGEYTVSKRKHRISLKVLDTMNNKKIITRIIMGR